MNQVAPAELLMALSALVFWLVPLIALGWALVTLQRIRTAQEAMRETLAAIQRQLQQAPDR